MQNAKSKGIYDFCEKSMFFVKNSIKRVVVGAAPYGENLILIENH